MVFRIIFIGDPACGKSSIIRRYCENEFSSSYSPSLSIERYERIKICSLSNGIQIPVSLQLWDTSSIWHPDIIKQYFAGMHCVVIVFDAGMGSAESLKKWHQLLENFVKEMNVARPMVCIVGNNYGTKKCSPEIVSIIGDLTKNPYLEVNAKTGVGINNLFSEIAYALIKEYPQLVNKNNIL
ncbi:MAG: putative small GTP-binding protein [Hyperionvirus sp.]|uniref:Putative small GTP-binding protein n=1 Tax=Hyperionvirus sp. TaxID=2487770 RepID=A0A3G5A8S4_9VIRU|nr:MAG: putative small GTP-binding protein [Hyperionvirus sp.]